MSDTTDESCDHMWNDSDHCIDCGAEIDHHLGCPADPDPDYEAEAQARGLAPHGKLLAVDAEGADDTLRVVALQAARDVRYEIDDWDDTWDETALAVLGAVMNEYEQRIASAVASEFCRIRKLATDSGAIYRTGSNGSRHFASFADLMDNSAATMSDQREAAFQAWWLEVAPWLGIVSRSDDRTHEAFCAGWEAAEQHALAAAYSGHDMKLAIEAARRAERQTLRDRILACQVAVQLPHVGEETAAVLVSDLAAILVDGAP